MRVGASQLPLQQAEGALHGISLDVDNPGHQPAGLQRSDAGLHILLATGGQQHVDEVGTRVGLFLALEVDGHFTERVRNVLVGLDDDLVFHLGVVHRGVHFDDLGDDSRSGNGDGSFLCGRLQDRQRLPDGVAHGIDVTDVLLDHRVHRQLPDDVVLDAITPVLQAELEQLHGGGTDVHAQQGSCFSAQKLQHVCQPECAPLTLGAVSFRV